MLQGICPRGEMTPGDEMTHLISMASFSFSFSLLLYAGWLCDLASWLPGFCYCLFALKNNGNNL